MRRRPANKMPSEPDYSAVPGEDTYHDDLEDGSSVGTVMPSSFYSQKKRKQLSLIRRSFNCRRRVVFSAFISSVILLSFYLGLRRGHIQAGGAGHYLGTTKADPSVVVAAEKGMNAMRAAARKLQITTWNIAAINNNPFEYWITYEGNPAYDVLMVNVENFLENPGEKDVPVSQVFTDAMFSELDAKLVGVGWSSVKSYWDSDFENRKIVTEFMKDPKLGSKRLASMPDRITNTINVEDKKDPVCRPTVINMFDGDLGDMSKWWNAWKQFMFEERLKIKTKNGVVESIPYSMLQSIKKSKYPDITEQEEKDSLPLQTMCGAIFDAILVHMMNTVSPPSVWQDIKKTMVSELIKMKFPHTLQILEQMYMDSDVITLQEVSSSFVDLMSQSNIGSRFYVVAPGNMDTARDQNSVILLNRITFPGGPSKEITSSVEKSFPPGVDVPVAKGDILAIVASDLDGIPYVVASFHGDTNGLATEPVLDAIMKTMKDDSELVQHQLIFGLDANTYEHAKPKQQESVVAWGKHYTKHDLTSCWGDVPNPSNYTTYNARTYLQPQLNKACKKEDKRTLGDVNPKDFILFRKKAFEVVSTWKDNTGEKKYVEDMAFPTLKFPSDHAILSTIIRPKDKR